MLQNSGERFLPDQSRGAIRHEHLHRYALCLELARGRDVLDVACGEGYGSAMMATVAKSVVGVDIAVEAVEFARHRYYCANARFMVGDCVALPLADASVDVIVSFETIEHHGRHDEMMAEFRRVLRPGGVLVISSPNRLVYSDERNFQNPFHVKELYFDEFAGLLQRYFSAIVMHGQRIAAASFIYPLGTTAEGPVMPYVGTVERIEQSLTSLKSPVYFIAICSSDESKVEQVRSLFIDAEEDLLRILDADREDLARQVRDLTAQVQGMLDRVPMLPMLSAADAKEGATLLSLTSGDAAAETLEELHAARATMAALRAQLDAQAAELEEHLAKAETSEELIASLNGQVETARAENTRIAVELSSVRSEHDRVVTELAAVRTDGERLAAELAAARTDGERLTAELVAARVDGERLNAELDAFRAAHESIVAELDHERSLNVGARDRELEELKASVSVLEEKIRYQASVLQTRSVELHDVQRRASAQMSTLSAIVEDEELLRAQLRAMTAELISAQAIAVNAAARLGEATSSRAWRLANFLRHGSRRPE